jgi:hypothetical protein
MMAAEWQKNFLLDIKTDIGPQFEYNRIIRDLSLIILANPAPCSFIFGNKNAGNAEIMIIQRLVYFFS